MSFGPSHTQNIHTETKMMLEAALDTVFENYFYQALIVSEETIELVSNPIPNPMASWSVSKVPTLVTIPKRIHTQLYYSRSSVLHVLTSRIVKQTHLYCSSTAKRSATDVNVMGPRRLSSSVKVHVGITR